MLNWRSGVEPPTDTFTCIISNFISARRVPPRQAGSFVNRHKGTKMLFSAPQRAADALRDRERLHLQCIVLKETPSGTISVGVRRYRGQKTGSVSSVTSVPSDYLERDHDMDSGNRYGEKDYLSDQFLCPDNSEGNGCDIDKK
jgi:hypothetical protein